MKTGIELIAQERKEQIEKHGRSVALDKKINNHKQLLKAAIALQIPDKDFRKRHVPDGWDLKIWKKMCSKSLIERLKISGSFFAAEIDRIQKEKK